MVCESFGKDDFIPTHGITYIVFKKSAKFEIALQSQ